MREMRVINLLTCFTYRAQLINNIFCTFLLLPINFYFIVVSLVLLLLLLVVFVVRSHGFDCSSDSEQGTRARCKVYEMRR